LILKSDISKNEYASFYGGYIDLVKSDVTVVEALNQSFSLVLEYFENLSEENANFRYAQDKWSLKEMLLHCIDTERIMVYRALRFSRNDTTELPGFDQDIYVLESEASKKNIAQLIEEYKSVRNATLSLFKGFSTEQLKRTGIANGKRMSVRALGFVISGHELHHLNICKERYISN